MDIVINDVSKVYKEGTKALSNFSLELSPGIIGLLGPNGAGKSTLMRILSTIQKQTSGTITADGINISKDPDYLRSNLGYLPQYFGIYPNLTANEFLTYLAVLKGIDKQSAKDKIDELLVFLNLDHAKNKKLKEFSGGMKQRVGIAQALLNDPKVLIVDEPTAGLDPVERRRFTNLLTELSEDKLIILSSHIVSDIESTATDIAIINKGMNVVKDTPEALLSKVKGMVYKTIIQSHELSDFRKNHVITSTYRKAEGVEVRYLTSNPIADDIAVVPNLEEAYIYLIRGD